MGTGSGALQPRLRHRRSRWAMPAGGAAGPFNGRGRAGAVLPPSPRLSGTDGAERGRAARSTRSSQPPPGEPRLCLRPVGCVRRSRGSVEPGAAKCAHLLVHWTMDSLRASQV